MKIPASPNTKKSPATSVAAEVEMVAADPGVPSTPAAAATRPKKAAHAPTVKAATAPGRAAGSASPVLAPSEPALAASPAAAAEAAALSSFEPTPRPLGKRAAKKIMLEQMTQAAVLPTHAANAAKATFSTMNSRASMIPAAFTPALPKDLLRADNWKSLPLEQLTDQDVLAMPDSEYMSELQLAFFRRKLCQLKDGILANAGETTEHLREDAAVVPDPADRATIEEEHALELRTRDRERKLLKKIEQAIARIDSGDYGYCDETGEIIGVGRLIARPTASLSLEAQQRRELKQKMFGD